MRKIILASASPRRRMLLDQLGLQFKVVVSNFEEFMDPKFSPSKLSEKLSLGKAQKVAKKHKNALIIAADSFVVCNGKYIGKPSSKEHAKQILALLSGKKHIFITGFTILDSSINKSITTSVETQVYFKKLTPEEIDAYVESGEPMGKAGAYAISEKGAVFIEKIEGDYSNILGLPLFTLAKELQKFGVQML